MFWDVVKWVAIVYMAGMGLAAMQEVYARGRGILDALAARRHRRQMEFLEKELELAKLRTTQPADGLPPIPEAPPCDSAASS